MATTSFVAATQKWVMNRIEEVKNYVQDVKGSIVEVITNLSNIHDQDMKAVGTKFSQLSDEVVTGKLTVDGDASVGGSLSVDAGITSAGLASSGPVLCTDPAGLLIKTPGRVPTGLNSTTLSIVNERGKMARFFMRGDKLYYDYPYDKIYTYFEASTGATLQYLKRGETMLHQLVAEIERQGTDAARVAELERWFNSPEQYHGHPEARLFNCTVRECFPAIATPFMIPESMLFTVPEMWRIKSIKRVDAQGQAQKLLYDFGNTNIKRFLINFPFVRRQNEEFPQQAPIPVEDTSIPTAVPVTDMYGTSPVAIEHVADFHNGYYEVTDPDARFYPTLSQGLIPNIILKLDRFPKDQPSVIYFDVVRA